MSLWLSHHAPSERQRTYSLRGVRVCARCLGTYPTLLLALGLQAVLAVPLKTRADLLVSVGLLVPALVDWGRGQLAPHAGSNAVRTLTGVLLGLALGRTLFLHFHRPYPRELLLQGALVLAVAGPIWMLRFLRRRR